ncbi:ATP synthase subunit d, mitochondrial-like [Liolophura sinensis]|uniref:ATP synthase subunit d, mitochondrial-like n=1 Tax=Liolophura sinensis TaxID=3198878 RepID=UPI003157F2D6
MAARRLAKSAVDWTAFAERVPPAQKEYFRAFKARSEGFVNRVHQYPEKLPAIDFAFYKRALASPALAEQFEKSYQGLNIPYPKDKSNLAAKVDSEKSAAEATSKSLVKELQEEISQAKQVLSKLDSLPPPEHMTLEMYSYYFPENDLDPNKPTHWPHTPEFQPANKKDLLM